MRPELMIPVLVILTVAVGVLALLMVRRRRQQSGEELTPHPAVPIPGGASPEMPPWSSAVAEPPAPPAGPPASPPLWQPPSSPVVGPSAAWEPPPGGGAPSPQME